MQDSPASDSAAKYRLKLKTDDGKEFDEGVKIDTQKGTDTFHVPKTSPDNEEADIILDFNKVSDYLACAGAFTTFKLRSAFAEVILNNCTTDNTSLKKEEQSVKLLSVKAVMQVRDAVANRPTPPPPLYCYP